MKITDLGEDRAAVPAATDGNFNRIGYPERKGSPWRKDLQPASFRGAFFHVETNSKENGRRIVVHEFPKKDLPYAEDMGRRAYEFSVRGYCIVYPKDLVGERNELYRRDYRIARNRLDLRSQIHAQPVSGLAS